MTVRHIHLAIVGSGLGGLGTAIQLASAGFHDYLVPRRKRAAGVKVQQTRASEETMNHV